MISGAYSLDKKITGKKFLISLMTNSQQRKREKQCQSTYISFIPLRLTIRRKALFHQTSQFGKLLLKKENFFGDKHILYG
jgi:hypothetical protein